MGGTGGLVALGADALHLAGVDGGFHLHDATLIGLGTGLNLRKGALPPELIYASSLEEITGRAPEPEEILEKYLPEKQEEAEE